MLAAPPICPALSSGNLVPSPSSCIVSQARLLFWRRSTWVWRKAASEAVFG